MKNQSKVLSCIFNHSKWTIFSTFKSWIPDDEILEYNRFNKDESIKNSGRIKFKIIFETQNQIHHQEYLLLPELGFEKAVQVMRKFDIISTYFRIEDFCGEVQLKKQNIELNTIKFDRVVNEKKLKMFFQQLISPLDTISNDKITKFSVHEIVPLSFNERAYHRKKDKDATLFSIFQSD